MMVGGSELSDACSSLLFGRSLLRTCIISLSPTHTVSLTLVASFLGVCMPPSSSSSAAYQMSARASVLRSTPSLPSSPDTRTADLGPEDDDSRRLDGGHDESERLLQTESDGEVVAGGSAFNDFSISPMPILTSRSLFHNVREIRHTSSEMESR